MNLLHLKYAVEIAEAGSINKASEKLYVGQPNLSRAIKELEAHLGVEIFERTPKGMFLTSDGEIFISYAKNILKQVDATKELFRKGNTDKKCFSLSAPRASYISDAFSQFSNTLIHDEHLEIYYQETNSMNAIENILHEDYRLGIIRYAENYDKYYKSLMDEKGLSYELVTEFHYLLLVNADSPLAAKAQITFANLREYIEIAHSDPFVPSLPFNIVKKEELPDDIHRRIFVFERASQFDLLLHNPQTFMWVSPVPDATLKRYGLVQRVCEENKRVYKDMIIHKKDYTLSELDHHFISELCISKREAF